MVETNAGREWVLRRKPEALVQASDVELVPSRDQVLGEGDVRLQLIYISMDPGQQFYMSADADVGGGTMRLGDVVRAWAVGRVIESRSDAFPVGSYAKDRYGFAGVRDTAVLPEGQLFRVDPDVAPLSTHISVLGMTGLTAYLGLVEIGRPEAGETVVVSGAAGAVGSVVGQLAKAFGCRAVGIAGGPEKCSYVVDKFGFDACIDYRSETFEQDLAQACPKGIDVYFDNVAGRILDACLGSLAFRGRVVSCGMIAEYSTESEWTGLRNHLNILIQSGRWEGLSIHNFYDQYNAVYGALENLYREGKLVSREDIAVGLENFVPVFHRLFTGDNNGKLILQVRESTTL